MKKYIALGLLAVLGLAFAGCAGGESAPEGNKRVYEAPPVLAVVCGEKEIEAMRGTSSWSYRQDEDNMVSVESDSMHPLEAKEYMPVLKILPSTMSHIEPMGARLRFEVSPDKVSVRCWNSEYYGNKGAQAEEIPVFCADNNTGEELFMIILKEGEYIYEVRAEWNRFEEFGGDAHYSFLAVSSFMAEPQ